MEAALNLVNLSYVFRHFLVGLGRNKLNGFPDMDPHFLEILIERCLELLNMMTFGTR